VKLVGGLRTTRRRCRLATALLGVAVVASVAPAAAEVRAPAAIKACSLFRAAEVARVLGSPPTIQRGASPSDCILYGDSNLPVIVLANSSGNRGYRNLIRAASAPVKRLRGVGTEAVMYNHFFEDPPSVGRGVIVRKAGRVLQLTTSGVGMDSPGLARLDQLIALARIAVRRL